MPPSLSRTQRDLLRSGGLDAFDHAAHPRRAVERFGLYGLLLGFVALVIALVVMPHGTLAGLGVAASGVIVIAWDVYRRVRRRAIIIGADIMAVYRRGVLADVVRLGDIADLRLSWYRTFHELGTVALSAMVAALAIGLAIGSSTLGLVFALAVAVATLLSAAWTRVLCRHFVVPRGANLMLLRDDVRRVGLS